MCYVIVQLSAIIEHFIKVHVSAVSLGNAAKKQCGGKLTCTYMCLFSRTAPSLAGGTGPRKRHPSG